EERLEQMVVAAVDQRDLDIGVVDLARRVQPAEAPADDHHLDAGHGDPCAYVPRKCARKYRIVSMSVSCGSRATKPRSRSALAESTYQNFCPISTATRSAPPRSLSLPHRAVPARASRSGSLSRGPGTLASRSGRPRNGADVRFGPPGPER